MPCYRPLTAWQLVTGEVTFKERGNILRELTLPCGRCIGCRIDRSKQWAVRCIHENQLHERSAFVTLTYDDAHCPGTLIYKHYQRFMRNLRRKHGKVRFYMCGEYGDRFLRPHYHALLWGVDFPDREEFFRSPSGSMVYRSPTLQSLWPYGFTSLGDVTFESAAYVARYVLKKISGPKAEAHYQRVDADTGEIIQVEPEFTRMSLKPGIGADWLHKYPDDVYTSDCVRLGGRTYKTPRYYDKLLEGMQPEQHETLSFERETRAAPFACDNTRDRLKVREEVALAQHRTKVRNLE